MSRDAARCYGVTLLRARRAVESFAVAMQILTAIVPMLNPIVPMLNPL